MLTFTEYAGLLSGSASLEEQVTGLKDEVRSSNVVVNNQLSTIQSLSGEKSILQVFIFYKVMGTDVYLVYSVWKQL